MNDVLALDLDFDILSETLFSGSFVEFCADLDAVDRMFAEHQFFIEEVDDRNLTWKKGAARTLSNTVGTTRDTVGAWNSVTRSNATVIKSAWDLFMQGMLFITRIVRFVSQRIADIPRFIGAMFRKVARIPPNLKNKISGDISLYIAAADLESLYNTNLFARIDSFMADAETLAKGDFWGRWLWHKRKDDSGKHNDMRICARMAKSYAQLKDVVFVQRTISMRDKRNIDLYFGDSKSITFKDLNRNEFSGTYYEALIKLMNDIKVEQEKMEVVDKALGAKYEHTKANSQFGNLPPADRQTVQEALQQTVRVITLIGNIIKYVMSDMAEIQKGVNAIMGHEAIQVDKSKVKEAKKAAKEAQKKPKV